MAVTNKDFKVKHGLIVEGSSATVNGNQVLTENASDQYIIDLIGGETLITSVESTQMEVVNGELNIKSGVFDVSGAAAQALSDAEDYTDNALLSYTPTSSLDSTIDGYGYLKSADLAGYATESYVDQAQTDAETFATNAINELTTDDIEEGATNKYFSNTLARDAVSAGDGLNYNSSTGEFSAHLGNGLEMSPGGSIQIDDSIVVTEVDLAGAFTDHNVSSGVHGVTGDVVGTTDAQTISNKTLGGDLAANGFQITNLGTPNNSTDAATKGYVDAVSEGLHVHPAARAAILTNVAINTGLENGDTAGGVTLVTGDRILLNGQTNGAENGIYVVQASGAALRAADFDTALEIDSGDFIFVSAGTYANTGWVQTLKPAIIGTDPISFTQFSGAGTFTAGNGLNLDGTVFSINEAVTATRTYVDTELEAHIELTDNVHGVTGTVVGTSDSQTLTNKTLGSGTVLSANIDAANTYTIENLEEPTSNQDAATKYYVDTQVSNVGGDLSTHETATTGVHGVTGHVVGTSDSQTLTNKTIDASSNTISNIANSSLTHSEVTINNTSVSLGSSITLDTDDIAEGEDNLYFTDSRAASAAAALLTSAIQTNISITGTGAGLTITAEDGIEGKTTDDLDEGVDNLYFTEVRAIDALQNTTPVFSAVDIDSVAKQIAATVSAPTAGSQVTAYSFAKADYRSAEFLVKTAYGVHTEISKVLVTLDTADNIAVTEYGTIGTNGSSMTVTADVVAGDVRLRVTPANVNSTVTVVGTLLA